MRLAIATVTVLALGSLAAAQHQQGHTPYAGLQNRAVKALSEQQVSDLRAGRGMSLALAAELNGYPGPLHVLELADQLELSAALRERVRLLYDEMKAEAVPVGETLVAYESELDRAFAERTISPDSLAALTAQIGGTQGRLRAIHLKYHLIWLIYSPRINANDTPSCAAIGDNGVKRQGPIDWLQDSAGCSCPFHERRLDGGLAPDALAPELGLAHIFGYSAFGSQAVTLRLAALEPSALNCPSVVGKGIVRTSI